MFQTQANLTSTCIKAICLTNRANTQRSRKLITHTDKSQGTQPSLLWSNLLIITSKRDSSYIERSKVLLILFCNPGPKLKTLIAHEGKKSQHRNQGVRRNANQLHTTEMELEAGAKAEVSLEAKAIAIHQGHQND